jgi:hypothetical protein
MGLNDILKIVVVFSIIHLSHRVVSNISRYFYLKEERRAIVRAMATRMSSWPMSNSEGESEISCQISACRGDLVDPSFVNNPCIFPDNIELEPMPNGMNTNLCTN